MPNSLSPTLVSNLLAPDGSSDPFLTLVTLSHTSFADDIRLVNNTEDIDSNGETFLAFPMRIRFPVDDGESSRDFTIEFDNVSLYLVEAIRSVTDPINVKIELILASMPDDIQITQSDLKIQSINYTATKITANIIMDNFLNTEMSSERYTPSIYPGIFQ